MTSENRYSLYEYLLTVTNGNYTKHTIRKAFQDLAKESNVLHFRPESANHTLVSVDECNEPEGGQLLAASSTVALPETLYVKPNASLVIDEETLYLTKVSDKQSAEYWLSDETGMLLKPLTVAIECFTLIKEPRVPERERRLSLVTQYFDLARNQLNRPSATNTEIYEYLGSPDRETLWRDWARLWPNSFHNFQKNDFSHPPLKGIDFKYGTAVSRKKIKIKINLDQ